MTKTLEAIKKYLFKVLHVQSRLLPWKERDQLPYFLTELYEFYETSLLGQPCLLVIAKEVENITPMTVKKHWELLSSKWSGVSILVQTSITPHNRERLIHYHIPFIIPGNQMYLPDLGIDLREYFSRNISRRNLFSPAAQATIIYALCHGESRVFSPSMLAKALGYSRVTLTRVFDEIEALGIGKVYTKGKGRFWAYKQSRRELWKEAEPYLQNPVKKRVWIRGKEPEVLAGLSALAVFTMLNPPKIPIFATNLDGWRQLKQEGCEELPIPDEATAQLEIWTYNPKLFSKDERVDLFSLFFSLKETTDERVDGVLEKMMEEIE